MADSLTPVTTWKTGQVDKQQYRVMQLKMAYWQLSARKMAKYSQHRVVTRVRCGDISYCLSEVRIRLQLLQFMWPTVLCCVVVRRHCREWYLSTSFVQGYLEYWSWQLSWMNCYSLAFSVPVLLRESTSSQCRPPKLRRVTCSPGSPQVTPSSQLSLLPIRVTVDFRSPEPQRPCLVPVATAWQIEGREQVV